MTLKALATRTIERAPVPDPLTRVGIRALVARASRGIAEFGATAEAFAAGMTGAPIARHADAANIQHYEVPSDFFGLVLGPQRKYSCCLYEADAGTLAQAEELALQRTAANAGLADGQSILELGCGWGSLTLLMAQRYPRAHITAISNSRSQRAFIEGRASTLGLTNVRVLTIDMNDLAQPGTFDRVVSIEMFEHMANWRELLGRIASWLAPGGRLLVHVFAHRSHAYRFDDADADDWIAQHFFTGGIMPSHRLMHQFADILVVEREWQWSGTHYARTANDWLANLDCNEAAARRVLQPVYGADTSLWLRRWRLFFLATAGLFGHRDGTEWGVSQYMMRRPEGSVR
ncbi:MAG: cyclopropane-fatty-acyl-phospholipid synthase family protein [Hyphomicrobiaceae bacterium]|nr:cyclopropane-fatty-acyl-phospholipid synthase family protein [Hyphomicrobiaceae bacterium]